MQGGLLVSALGLPRDEDVTWMTHLSMLRICFVSASRNASTRCGAAGDHHRRQVATASVCSVLGVEDDAEDAGGMGAESLGSGS